MQRIEAPWGFQEILENNGKYVIKLLYVKPGEQLSTQYHVKKQESMYCLQGEGCLTLETQGQPPLSICHTLKKGVFHKIHPGVVHTLLCNNDSLEDLVMLECSTPELDDIVRLKDKYGRVEKK